MFKYFVSYLFIFSINGEKNLCTVYRYRFFNRLPTGMEKNQDGEVEIKKKDFPQIFLSRTSKFSQTLSPYFYNMKKFLIQ